MAEPSLSTLCSTCYTHPPKYRCPRCRTQTCSLPCYKTHQSRASCTGRRDPAAYVKKSQLATPSGIDRDYNYLKSVERSIQDAHADSAGSAGGRGGGEGGRQGAWKRYLTENGIHVVRAPRGMSRQRGNGSRVSKGGAVFWTVEWCFGDGGREREVRHQALGTSEVGELWRGVLAGRRKRERKDEDVGEEGQGARGAKKRRRTSGNGSTAREVGLGGGETEEASPPSPHHQADDSHLAPDQTPTSSSPSWEHSTPHFYLHLPSTPTPNHVLIPLTPTSTLTQALSGQTVHEYPTIYVLSAPPDNLPSGFITAEEHEAQVQKEGSRGAVVGEGEGEGGRKGEADAAVEGGGVDAKAILDMLKRDVRV